jgi:hypothetical protein
MSSSLPLEIAETIQTASIKRNPSPSHDLNPSTAASQKEPVKLSHPSHASASESSFAYDDEDGIDVSDEEEDIPYSVLKPIPRRQSFAPLPDLRFEQSYLSSIAGADTIWKVLFITVKDQVHKLLQTGYIICILTAHRSSSLSSKAWSGPSLFTAGDIGTKTPD